MAHTASLSAAAPSSLPISDEALATLAGQSFAAEMTMQQLLDSEASYDKRWGPTRRITLACLTRSKAELVASFSSSENGPELLMDMIEQAEAWGTHLRDGLEMAEAARARLMSACVTAMQQQEASNKAAA